MDDTVWESVEDNRFECGCAAPAARDPKHRNMECLAFGPGGYLPEHGYCHEATIWTRSADRRRDSQVNYGRSTTLALLDDGRPSGSAGHWGRQTTDAVYVRTE